MSIFKKKNELQNVNDIEVAEQISNIIEKYHQVSIIKTYKKYILQDNEFPLHEDIGELHEERSVRTHYGGGKRVGMGIYIGLGRSHYNGQIQLLDTGNILLTTKRIIFLGSKRTININILDIVGYETFSDAVRINTKNKQRATIFFLKGPNILSVILEFITTNKVNRSYLDTISAESVLIPNSNKVELITRHDWQNKYDDANNLSDNVNYQEAIYKYEELLSHTVEKKAFVLTCASLAMAYNELGILDKSNNICEQALSINPSDEMILGIYNMNKNTNKPKSNFDDINREETESKSIIDKIEIIYEEGNQIIQNGDILSGIERLIAAKDLAKKYSYDTLAVGFTRLIGLTLYEFEYYYRCIPFLQEVISKNPEDEECITKLKVAGLGVKSGKDKS